MSGADPFATLAPQPPDAVLSITEAVRVDPRADKIDLGVGVYRDENGQTPVLAAVRQAEQILAEEQTTKAYRGAAGDLEFLDAVGQLILSETCGADDMVAVQTPGGTAALRLAAELIAAAAPGARVWCGIPTWFNHPQIFEAAGVPMQSFAHARGGAFAIETYLGAIARAQPGDFMLLHGCCHNPTGADADLPQWEALTEALARRNVTPIIDTAYHGLGVGLDEDSAGLRHCLTHLDTVILPYSCSKNFGLYRERTGALFITTRKRRNVVRGNALKLARTMWSMPPDHGAGVVRIILGNPRLRADWTSELKTMRARISAMRHGLADADARFTQIAHQRGMFSILPLGPAGIAALQSEHAVYIAPDARMNIAGLNETTLPRFVAAFQRIEAKP